MSNLKVSLTKFGALFSECICKRTAKFHEKMSFDSGIFRL